jgi:Signal transduction histidine kinase
MILVFAFVAVLFTIVGQDVYQSYKADELVPRAQSISQQITQLYKNNADRRMIARMVYSDEFFVTESSLYVVFSDSAPISSDSPEDMQASAPFVTDCYQRIMDGETVAKPNTPIGVVVGVPIYDAEENAVGAVILINKTARVHQRFNSLALNFGIALVLILLFTLISLVLIFRSVTKPIRKIADTAIEMSRGDLSVRAEVKGSAEAQRLAESFNVLAGALQSNIDDLIIERNRLGTVLNGIGEGIVAVDKKGELTHYNSASLRLLGGRDDDQPTSLTGYHEIDSLVRASLDSNSIRTGMMKLGDRVLSTTVTPIHEDNDSLCGAVVLIHDVTEAERLEQTRRDYVANVSHELRTPLASIRSLADALNDGIITDEADQKRYYGYILRESIRLSHLIDDLLELSRLQSGGVAFSKERVELYEIVYDVADRMNETAMQHGGSVRLLIPEDEYYAHTNSDRIEQVLIALTDNAIKHGADGCRVDIELGLNEKGDSYIFTVSNPAEVDPADLDHIFERFYKADKAHTGEGTGLGLAIVHEVLNLLGEEISVDYNEGVIRFSFTVSRDARDGKHPALLSGSGASSSPAHTGSEPVLLQ